MSVFLVSVSVFLLKLAAASCTVSFPVDAAAAGICGTNAADARTGVKGKHSSSWLFFGLFRFWFGVFIARQWFIYLFIFYLIHPD